MDTKRNPAEEFSKAAALKARTTIEEFRPDVVIASDDNASKYLIMPYYKDAELPFVFCGINWDASIYGFPYKNVTGMIEVALVSEIFRHLKNTPRGSNWLYCGRHFIRTEEFGVLHQTIQYPIQPNLFCKNLR